MSDALGIELAADAVRVATATATGPSGEQVEWVPPALFVEGRDQFLHGLAALEAGATRPHGLITDVVGQFTVDRVFLTEGQMLTPDAVLHGLLAGILGSISQRRGAAPLAVTVTCPAMWDDATCGRVSQITTALQFPSCEIVRGIDAAAAAADAATRLPQELAAREAAGLGPDLESVLRKKQSAAVSSGEANVHRTDVGSNRIGVILTAVVLIAVAGVIGYLVVSSDDDAPETAVGASTTTMVPVDTSTISGTSITPPPARPMVLGVLTSADTGPEILAAVQTINDAGGVFEQSVLDVVEAPGADPAAVIGQMLRQGVTSLVADVSAPELDAALGASGRLAVCSTGTEPTAASDAVVVISTPTVCVETLALATESAGLTDAGIIAESLGEIVPSSPSAGAGVSCATYTQCRNLVTANQQVVYSPSGAALRRSTTT